MTKMEPHTDPAGDFTEIEEWFVKLCRGFSYAQWLYASYLAAADLRRAFERSIEEDRHPTYPFP